MVQNQLSAAQIALVQTSFAKLIPLADTAANLFYHRLFEIAPDVRPFFRNDLTVQGRRLMMTLSIVVGSLHDLRPIMPTVKSLAVKHVQYGVIPLHYAKVGGALLWTLERGLGDDFTPEVREAWNSVYNLIAREMIAEAYGLKSAA